MLHLPTLKTRLGLLPTDTTQDTLLTALIQAVSARFDRQCNRTFARHLLLHLRA